MKKQCYLASALLVLLFPLNAFTQEAYPELSVPARKVPVPTTVSPELQKAIAQPIPPVTTMPTTADGWRKLQQKSDAASAKLARAAAESLGVKIEPVKVAGVPCYRLTPKEVAAKNRDRLIVHVHGGSFVFYAGVAGAGEGVLLADACRLSVLSIDYRMPPDHPFPAATDDVLNVWKAVVAEHDPHDVALGGTSAGGGLIMTTLLRLREENLPRPQALFLGSPAADLSKTGDSVFLNAEVDNLLGRYRGKLKDCIELYAAGRPLKEPLLSPVYGDLSGFPPTILISGTRDLLLSDTVRTHRKLRRAGVTAELQVFEGMSHAAFLTTFPSPESREAMHEVALFFGRQWK